MSGVDIFFIIVLPLIVSCITIGVTLSMKWMLEREVNNKNPYSVFHFCNIMFTIMMCGTSSIVFHGMVLDGLQKGWLVVTLYAYVYPLPILLILYSICTYVFENYFQPYRIKKGSNVVYLRRKRT
ncbi:hypothetical protein [Alteribacillus iranensis]|uniref:Uncharacterized protein n=1 Tax=Alteribacillus iranensis TaxID=930128 RepID=A0A1I2FAA5_9BACI|nr:hypothetical protein [Alteribacillus iranensis]SFF02292.1 hypothetical protein SAMN05192532_11037 [Alteribacillus iranensis]